MKTVLDLIKDEGRIEGEIKAIQTVVSLRFQETSIRLTRLLPKLNDLKLLDRTCLFVLIAPSLLDVENFVEDLLPVKAKSRRVARRQTA